jgi:hypothetical protein
MGIIFKMLVGTAALVFFAVEAWQTQPSFEVMLTFFVFKEP